MKSEKIRNSISFFMRKNTFKDYKLAIKEQYALSKMDDVSGILANPTPAQLRTFCLLLSDKGLSKSDQEVFRIFFEQNEGEALKRAINRINIDKFRTIISFLRGEKDMDNPIRIEISAILVNLKERPYKVFSTIESNKFTRVDLPAIDKTPTPTIDVERNLEKDKKRTFLFWIGRNKFVTIFLIIASLLGGLSLSKFLFKEKNCLRWEVDRYVLIDCGDKENALMNQAMVYNDVRLTSFRKIPVNESTVFFSAEGRALIWYCKMSPTQIEFFNSNGNGFHPLTGKALNPITPYIIKKYVEKN